MYVTVYISTEIQHTYFTVREQTTVLSVFLLLTVLEAKYQTEVELSDSYILPLSLRLLSSQLQTWMKDCRK